MADQDMKDEQIITTRPLFNPTEVTTCVRFAPSSSSDDFSLLCTSNIYGQVKLYKFYDPSELIQEEIMKPIFEVKDHFFPVNEVAFCANVRTTQPYLVSCADDTLINMYDIQKECLIRCFIGHTSFVSHLKFNNVSNVLLSGGADNTIMLWDIRTNKAIFKLLAHPEPITSIDISIDNTLITSSSYDGYVRLWDMLKGQCLKTMVADSGSTSAIGLCRLSPNSKYLLFGNMNSKLSLYNYQNDLLKLYLGHKNQEFCLEALFLKNKRNNNSLIVSGSENGRICGWDMNSQDMLINYDITKDIQDESKQIVCSLDYDTRTDLIATSGNFKGVLFKPVPDLLSNQFRQD